MTPSEAANHYVYLATLGNHAEASSFARDYEEHASEEAFDAYLHFIDLHSAA
jgi:hypothetical protein